MADQIDDHAIAYDFVQLGLTLADTLTRAAEEQVDRAQQILDQTKAMADIIRTQVAAQAKQIEDMNGRFRAFGEQMLDAHRALNGNGPVIRERLSGSYREDYEPTLGDGSQAAELDKLERLADSRRDSDSPTNFATVASNVARDLLDTGKRAPQGDHGRVELPREVVSGEPSAPWVGYNHRAGTGTGDSGGRETAPAAASPREAPGTGTQRQHLRASRHEES